MFYDIYAETTIQVPEYEMKVCEAKVDCHCKSPNLKTEAYNMKI